MRIEEKDLMQHHSKEYPMEVGAPRFAPIDVLKQKDIMINAARANAEKEYNRIMESVRVLQQQADALIRRLEITEMVHSAKYGFNPAINKKYWLYREKDKNYIGLTPIGPGEWILGSTPESYEYIAHVKFLGDQTWEEVNDNQESGDRDLEMGKE
jgi:hypothetical protein